MTVWKRRDGVKPQYFVSNHETARQLEEFARYSSARKWAKENQKG